MATTVNKDVIPFAGQHVTLTSSKPLAATLAALYEELNKDKAGPAVFKILAESKSKQEIEERIGALTEGKRDLLFFATTSHGWLNKFSDHKLPETHVVTLGNPVLASTFVLYDLRASMYVPPRVLVQETAEGGTRVFYDLPSSIMIVDKDSPEEMKAAVKALDATLERLITKVLSD